ncbi:squalene/phytoene synthase family protein [bacterium]|nr:squalene/phytoene synthase family protein [bacterium]
MGSLPFLVQRPILLVQGMLLDRREPDLDHLKAIEDPERFGWAFLPHVARSFAASVVWLPKAAARAARVGYLYARMLDSYEDMVPDHEQRIAGLRWFATRFATLDLSQPPPRVDLVAANRREEVDKLLVERCALVDHLFLDLPDTDRDRVAVMVTAMASSMERWGAVFAAQGGVLQTTEQLDRYCDDVIGEPARFVTALTVRRELTEPQSKQLSDVAVFIQLANVTRDIERDLERGVAYHPSLQPFLGRSADEASEPIRRVRRQLLMRALRRAPSYTRLMNDLPLPGISAARGAGVVMLLFTDRYYRSCAVRAGHESWKGPHSTLRILCSSLLAVLSPRWTRRVGRRVEKLFLAAADATPTPQHP